MKKQYQNFKDGDIVEYDGLKKQLYIFKGRLGYCSSYGDFVALKNSNLPWKLVE